MTSLKVASVGELKPGEMKAVDAGGKTVLLANVEGAFYAIGNKCTHMGCSLSRGRLKGSNVECPCHGSTFDVKTGNVVRGPAAKPEPHYEVNVENDQVMISV
ncbi:MAG: Rieske (2Fe-2S) protein [Candidatus Bathyarchaeia archaeon]